MWKRSNKTTFTPSPKRTDFTSTWDVPVNPTKAKCVSDQEFLKLLDPSRVAKDCVHETKNVKCQCGNGISATRCIKCFQTFCSAACGKAASASSKPDEESLLFGDRYLEQPVPTAEIPKSVASHVCGQDAKNNVSRFDVKVPARPDNMLSSTRVCETVSTDKSSEKEDNERESQQKLKESMLATTTVTRIVKPVAFRSTKEGNGTEMNKISDINKKLVAGRGRGRGIKSRVQSTLSESALSYNPTKVLSNSDNLPQNTTPSQGETSETSLISDMTKANISNEMQPGQYDDVENTITNQPINDLVSLYKNLARFPKQPNLESLKGEQFIVTHVYAVNRIHVISSNVANNQKDDLLDNVNDACMDALSISGGLDVGDLVCALSDSNLMERAVVVGKLPDLVFNVKFLDFGGSKAVAMKDMKVLADDLLQTPLLGYEVKIEGLEEEPTLMLGSDISGTVLPWLLNKKLKMIQVKEVDGALCEAQFSSNKFENLALEILKFQVWEWERLFKSGLKNDCEILQGREWKQLHYVDLPLSYFPDHSIMMECARFDPESGIVMFNKIESTFLKRELNVLQLQINRYVDLVQEFNHYPKLNENFLFLPDPVVNCERYWRRATRPDLELIYCVDTCEFFPLKMNHETRFLCPDFLKVPTFVLQCEVVDHLKSSEKSNADVQDAATKTFIQHQRYAVKVVSYNAKTGMFKIKNEG